MKRNYMFHWLLLLFVITVSSCDKVLPDINEEFDLKATIDVSGANPAFVGEALLDAISESDLISEYAGHIKSIEVTEVRYYLSYFNGSASQQINNGTLEVANADGTDVHIISTVSNVNLMQATIESSLVFDQSAVDKLATLIKNDPHQAMIYLRGDLNESPADFTVVVKFRVKMVAEVI